MPAEVLGQKHRRQHRRNNTSPWYLQVGALRILVVGGLIVLLAGLSLHAGSLGLAHLQVIRVESALNSWHKQRKVPSPQAVISALHSIDRAMEWHVDNPHQYTLKARVLEWRGLTRYQSQEAAEDFRQALALHRRAAVLRPLWPNTWAEMINLKLRLNELDDELDRLIARASYLGPYTAPVHIAIVQADFARLANSSLMNLSLLEKHLLRGARDPRTQRRVKELIQQYGREALFCRWSVRTAERHRGLGLCVQ